MDAMKRCIEERERMKERGEAEPGRRGTWEGETREGEGRETEEGRGRVCVEERGGMRKD